MQFGNVPCSSQRSTQGVNGTVIYSSQGHFDWPVKVNTPSFVTTNKNAATRNTFLQGFGFVHLHSLGGKMVEQVLRGEPTDQ
jgi:hypothetical protein